MQERHSFVNIFLAIIFGSFHTQRDGMQKRLLRHIPNGFTLAEILIVVAIVLILLMIIALSNWRVQIDRGHDARRKSDLDKIRIALEDYYNDKNCYPPAGSFDTCDSTVLAPYIPKIPCDPQTKKPYLYVPESNPCLGYRACVALKDKGDSDIARLGCDPVQGCGWGAGYNYCLASGTTIIAPGFNPGVGGTPTPTPGGGGFQGLFACTPGGQCNAYADPPGSGCPVSFSEPTCNNACGNPANRCAN